MLILKDNVISGCNNYAYFYVCAKRGGVYGEDVGIRVAAFHLNKDGAIISIKNAAPKQWVVPRKGAVRLVAANKLIINVVP